MAVDHAAVLMKGGGAPKPPPPVPPPVPSTVAENTAKAYREDQRRRGTGFSGTILGGAKRPDQDYLLGG